MGKVQTLAPDMMKGFGSLFTSVMKEGALPLKYKELIALAMGVGSCCEPCINLHVKKCLNAGATKEEIMEAASVAVVMQGGPAYTYMPAVVDALEANGQ
ncbi:MAG TPA: carboxymuconolactone decarboxylase family protein [Verrucomicrobia bacterium]|nr:carboxymuconolactone decarboxylase family protein [Verrucomicrobiota bacterium]